MDGLFSRPHEGAFSQPVEAKINLKWFDTNTVSASLAGVDARALIKSLEKVDSSVIYNIIKGAEQFSRAHEYSGSNVHKCKNCSHPTSSPDCVCTACNMVEKLLKTKIS